MSVEWSESEIIIAATPPVHSAQDQTTDRRPAVGMIQDVWDAYDADEEGTGISLQTLHSVFNVWAIVASRAARYLAETSNTTDLRRVVRWRRFIDDAITLRDAMLGDAALYYLIADMAREQVVALTANTVRQLFARYANRLSDDDVQIHELRVHRRTVVQAIFDSTGDSSAYAAEKHINWYRQYLVESALNRNS